MEHACRSLFERGDGLRPVFLVREKRSWLMRSGRCLLEKEREKMVSAVKLPLLDEIAASLRETKRYQKELSEQDIAQIMGWVARSLLAGQAKIRAIVPKPRVHIENGVGTVSGTVRVEAPFKIGRASCRE